MIMAQAVVLILLMKDNAYLLQFLWDIKECYRKDITTMPHMVVSSAIPGMAGQTHILTCINTGRLERGITDPFAKNLKVIFSMTYASKQKGKFFRFII